MLYFISIQLIVSLVITVSCAHNGYRPTPKSVPNPVAVDSELEGLKILAAMPNSQPQIHIALAQQFIVTNRGWEGLAYFGGRTGSIALALQGVFMAQVASEVPLLKRISWVNDALGRLDRAVRDQHPVARLFRGVVSAAVPKRFGRARIAIRELSWVVKNPASFPVSVQRGALFGLAQAYAKLGDLVQSKRALLRSRHKTLDVNRPVFF